MDRSQFAAAPAAQADQARHEALRTMAPKSEQTPAAPQVLDERMLAKVVGGGLPRTGGW
jgi:hypothetical protein